MSGMLAPMGVLSGPMSEHFGVDVTAITARFSWLTMGVLAGAVIAVVIFDFFRLKKLMVAVYLLMASSLVSLLLFDDLLLTGFALGLVGLCCGIGLPGAALIISRSYDDEIDAL